ncbi:MAG: hypothetical protein MHPSP_002372, partial [Paramarteilia canceri]
MTLLDSPSRIRNSTESARRIGHAHKPLSKEQLRNIKNSTKIKESLLQLNIL